MDSFMVRYALLRINNMAPVPCELRVDHDVATLSSYGYVEDPTWTHVDSAGHFHAYSNREEQRYPTLYSRRVRVSDNEDNDEVGSIFYVCRICDEEVKPGGSVKLETVHMPGDTTFTLVTGHCPFDDLVDVSVRIQLSKDNPTHEYFGPASITHIVLEPGNNRYTLHARNIGQRACAAEDWKIDG